MNFDEKFIESLPADKYYAGKIICERFFEFIEDVENKNKLNFYFDFIEMYMVLEAFIESREFEYKLKNLSDDKNANIEIIIKHFLNFYDEIDKYISANEIEIQRNKYKGLFQVGFVYSFTDGDLKKIQSLINELRENITESKLFEDKHKERLLTKLEGLQKELHKKVSSLDKFWGLIGDAGVAIGKFGTDAKPFVDRIKEISEIIWRTQANAEELPSGTKIPLLGSNDD